MTVYALLQLRVSVLCFPIQTDLTYHNDVHPNNTATASVKSTFEPVLGNPTNFASTGIDPTQIFHGQELVAQVGACWLFSYNLPIVGSNNMGLWVGFDFTQLLPPPLQGGNFTTGSRRARPPHQLRLQPDRSPRRLV